MEISGDAGICNIQKESEEHVSGLAIWPPYCRSVDKYRRTRRGRTAEYQVEEIYVLTT